MKRSLFLLSVILMINNLFAQDVKPNFGISLSGFIKTDVMYDSRQTVSLREGHFLLFPSAPSMDKNNVDINEASNFNILSIQTRLVGKISGPDAFGVKTSGYMEGEFFGTSDADISGFRLRHAFVKLDWSSTSLLVGQYWHPMFVVEMFPGVVSFNTGAPFQPFSRNPQIRLTYTYDQFKFIIAALTQRDFQSYGPTSSTNATSALSTSYLRNAGIPNLHGQMQYSIDGHLLGAGIDYKKLTPRLSTAKSFKTESVINSISAIGFCKLNVDPITLKLEGTYAENLADQLMLGGYAVKSVDTLTDIVQYTPIKSFSAWGEISTGKEIEVALFAGIAWNLGAKDNIVGSYYSRGSDIDYAFRISPRVQWNSEKTRISGEIEYTQAGYGIANNANKGIVGNAKAVSNTRILLALFYFF